MSFRVLCVGLLIASVYTRNVTADTEWIPVDWKTLPKADPNEVVDIYYLVAPLLEETYGNLLGDFNVYHGAIAFRYRSTNFSLTINYDALDFVHSSLFPDIVVNSTTGQKDLLWRNGGAAIVYKGINAAYWETVNEMVGSIDGTGFNTFMSGWNAKVNQTWPFYNMFALESPDRSKTYVPGWNCFDYAWNAFHELQELGAKLFSEKVLYRNFASIYTEVKPLNVTDQYDQNPILRQQIISFYELLQLQKDMAVQDIMITLFQVLNGVAFLRSSTDYWLVKLEYPFVDLRWEPYPLPPV